MTDREKLIIRQFAGGWEHLKDEAIYIHRKYILTLGVRGTPEQQFMAEIDHPCPDLTLRAAYRAKLLSIAYQEGDLLERRE